MRTLLLQLKSKINNKLLKKKTNKKDLEEIKEFANCLLGKWPWEVTNKKENSKNILLIEYVIAIYEYY